MKIHPWNVAAFVNLNLVNIFWVCKNLCRSVSLCSEEIYLSVGMYAVAAQKKKAADWIVVQIF